jgi:hypothetical protein
MGQSRPRALPVAPLARPRQTGRVTRTARLACVLVGCLSACASPDGSNVDAGALDATLEDASDTSGASASSDGAAGDDADDDTMGTTPDAGDDASARPGNPRMEDFDGPDGDPWPAPWIALGGVAVQQLEHGRGRIASLPQAVARMGLPDIDALDFDVEATVELTDWTRQALAIYVRHNGGWLLETDPPGQGYAMLLEGGPELRIGLWRERSGVEELVGHVAIAEPIDPLVPHRVRFQCVQLQNATLLRTKIWQVDAPEPDAWAIELIDVSPDLQDVAGDIAIDLHDGSGSGSVYVDDFVMRPLP